MINQLYSHRDDCIDFHSYKRMSTGSSYVTRQRLDSLGDKIDAIRRENEEVDRKRARLQQMKRQIEEDCQRTETRMGNLHEELIAALLAKADFLEQILFSQVDLVRDV